MGTGPAMSRYGEGEALALLDVLPFVLTYSDLGQGVAYVSILRCVSRAVKSAADDGCAGKIRLRHFMNDKGRAEAFGSWVRTYGYKLRELDLHLVSKDRDSKEQQAEREVIAAGFRQAAAAAKTDPTRRLRLQRYTQSTSTFPTILAQLPNTVTELHIAPVATVQPESSHETGGIAGALSALPNLKFLAITSPLDWMNYLQTSYDILSVTPYLQPLASLTGLTKLHLRQVPSKQDQKLLPPQLRELSFFYGASDCGDGPILRPIELGLRHLKQLTKLDMCPEAYSFVFGGSPVGARIRSGALLPPNLRELHSMSTECIEPLLGLEHLEVFVDRQSNLSGEALLQLAGALPTLETLALTYETRNLAAAVAAAPAWGRLTALQELSLSGSGESCMLPGEVIRAVGSCQGLRRLKIGQGTLEGVQYSELAGILGGLSRLEELELLGVQVGAYNYRPRGRVEFGLVMQAVVQLPRLRSLHLDMPLVKEAALPLVAATQLTRLDLLHCSLDPVSVANLAARLAMVKQLLLK